MDLLREIPQNEACNVIQNAAVSAFGLTFQGASHKQSSPVVPCQDYHAMRWMEEEQIFVAAIADGVGSCNLSHWGAYIAVNAALDSVEESLKTLSIGNKRKLNAEDADFRKMMKEVMLSAFRAAQSEVEKIADESLVPQPVFLFQSTLTLAIYDGTCLYHGHAGDDGIVAQLPSGTVEMATRRMKGEEASSVYPLQTGETAWCFGVVPTVSGFVMATDGVLDSFVQNHSDYYGINYCNGICYTFMENAMKLLAQDTPNAAKNSMEEYRRFLQSEEYTQQVTDDLTIVAVVSPKRMTASQPVKFNLKLWNTIAEESWQAKRDALYYRPSKVEHPIQLPITPNVAEMPPPRPKNEPVPYIEPASEPYDKKRRSALVSLLICILIAVLLALSFFTGKMVEYRQSQPKYDELAKEHADIIQEYDGIQKEHENLQEINAALERKSQKDAEIIQKLTRSLEEQKYQTEQFRQQLEQMSSSAAETESMTVKEKNSEEVQ